MIRDDWQGRGLGRGLLSHLIDIARENGIAGFTGEVLAENRPMQHVFHRSALEVQSQFDRGVYRMTLDLSPAKSKLSHKKKGRQQFGP